MDHVEFHKFPNLDRYDWQSREYMRLVTKNAELLNMQAVARNAKRAAPSGRAAVGF